MFNTRMRSSQEASGGDGRKSKILVDDVRVACTAFVGMHAVRGARPKGEGEASLSNRRGLWVALIGSATLSHQRSTCYACYYDNSLDTFRAGA